MTYVLLFWSAVFWGGNIVAGKVAVTSFGALGLAQLRLAGTAVVFCALFAVRRRRLSLHLTGREWLVLLTLGFNGLTLNQIFFIGGVARTSVVHAALIVALGPVMILALACMMRLEPLTVIKMLGMLISVGGVAVLTLGNAEQGGGAHWQGDVSLLLGSLSFALYTIQLKGIADRFDSLTLNTLSFGIGSLLMIPFAALPILRIPWEEVPLRAWNGLAFMIVFGSVVCFLIYAFALARLSASRVAAFTYLQPVVAVLLGVWLLGERLTLRAVVGGALILLGVHLAERERGEEKRACAA